MRWHALDRGGPSLKDKLLQIRWLFVLALCATAGVGVAMLYSAAGGSMEPWAIRQLVRFLVALGILLVVAVSDIRLWLRLAYPIYFVALVLLVIVDFAGFIGMGAQRWIDLGIINLQPSEVMKVALVLALARYFHGLASEDVGRPWRLIVPALMVLAPVALVLKQPDLGTAMMLLIGGAALFFTAGVRLWMFAVVGAAGLAALPLAWQMLHDYQRRRVLTFLDPETDPLGSGYHILQSKIALGSGGVFGKGYLQGTQSHLNFLPEKQTDFIFTMLAEEFGLLGSLGMLTLYVIILAYCLAIALSAKSQFGRLLAIGITVTFFLYVFINMAMVMGLIPVVGIPLPLVSYGGTAIVSLMLGFGLVMCVYVHRDVMISRHSTGEEL
ncbi:MAG TPA: rod shape-determining protein RodA [Rhodospirillales bacterium]|nr:rod shape-determining protein RodA [Rhodospirillales bacterium]